MPKVVLFDADGVLTIPEEFFSVVYAHSHGLDEGPFKEFFKTEWTDFVTGKRDVKDHIRDNPQLWQWDGTPDKLLEYWCKIEDIRNDEMIQLVDKIREAGTPCYLATEQEKHRGAYMKNVMFKDLFDGYYVTAEIGFKKSDPRFFEVIIEDLSERHNSIKPKDVLFFDDSQSKVDSAIKVGINGHLFVGIDDFRERLVDENILR